MEYQYASEVRIFELVTRILCDYIPLNKIDAICIHGETIENEETMLKSAALNQQMGFSRFIAVGKFDGEKKGDFEVSGWENLKGKMVGFGTAPENIISFPLSTELPPCTDAEAIGLVEFAKIKGWQSICSTVPPLHQVRTFISVASAAIKRYPALKVYSAPADAPAWTENVFHSQTAPKAKRYTQFGGELQKLIRYWKKGDHVSPDEILDYLNRRDQ